MFLKYRFFSSFLKILTITLFIVSCSDDIPEVNTSDVSLNLEVKRLELDLFKDEKSLTFSDYQALRTNYGKFFKLFTEHVIAVGRIEDSGTVYYLNHFKNDLQVQEIALKTQEIYPELSNLNYQLTEAFKKYSVLFPNAPIPTLYSFISAFSYTIVVDDSLLGIGLDMYLGSDEKFYRLLGIPAYKVRNMTKNNVSTDCMRSWLTTEFELGAESSDLLSNMIYHGKILYALDLLLPEVADSIKMGYSTQNLKWVKENEKDMWFHFAENELLFTKEGKEIQKYIGEAPFTPGFPEGSPGMVGRWIGWQIVRAYMKNTDALNVKSLFQEGDAQMILKKSKYKPI